MVQKLIQFLKEVRLELSKVAYPTRVELIGSTTVVAVMTLIMSIFIGIVDFGLSQMTQVILK